MRAALGNGTWQRDVALFVVAIMGVSAAVAFIALTSSSTPAAGGVTPKAMPQGLGSFDSYGQLQQYISANAKSAQQYNRWGVGFGGGVMMEGAPGAFAVTSVTEAAATSLNSATTGYTTTNNQVQGVDELDRVKTDGTHLFVSNQDSVSIINAYPPNSTGIISKILLPNSNIAGIEIAQDRLMIVESSSYNQVYPGPFPLPVAGAGVVSVPPYFYSPRAEFLLYDTTNLSSPKLMQNVTVSGSYVSSRLADGYLYAVIQQPSYIFYGQGNVTTSMPTQVIMGSEEQIAPSSVYYTTNAAQISDYTIIPSISMMTGKENVVSVLTGPSSTIYVSTSNLYVVYTNYPDVYDVDGVPGNFWSGGVISPTILQQSQNSTILRAAYLNGTVTVSKSGVVPGTVLNQFSMDEYNGYFRIATSRFAMINGAATTSDDVYVLDQNMNQASSLVDIAPGENIYAVRFVGDTGYVVTFQQIDPLFVISFKDVSHPVIQSALKVNGYSDYLHPLPGGYLLGVGKDTVPASNGNYSYYLGLKLSLFRVFDNGSSIQVGSPMLIGDRGTDSPVLSDHLAFTYDQSKNITVIPLTLYLVSGNQTEGGFPAYGNPVWQGAYVVSVTPSGFTLLGKVSQYTAAGQNFADSPNNGLQIDRSVIIGDYLYTISQSEVMVSSLSSFSTVATVQLPG